MTHLDLAKIWDQRGNHRQVRAIAKSFFRLWKMKNASAAGTVEGA